MDAAAFPSLLRGEDANLFYLRVAVDSDAAELVPKFAAFLKEYDLPLLTEPGGHDEMILRPGSYYRDLGDSGCSCMWLLMDASSGEMAGSVAVIKQTEETCELGKMFLVSKYRGRGLGTALVSFVLQRSRALGFHRIVLDTVSCLKEAVGLYKKLGFAVLPSSSEHFECDLLMARDL